MCLEDILLRALKVAAAGSGQRECQVVEQALPRFLGMELRDKVGSRSSLSEKGALALAYGDLRRSRSCPPEPS